MTDTSALERGAATGAGDRSRPRAALPALCATQITSWGIVYYAFPVLNPQITAATGWPTGATTAAFSGAPLAATLANHLSWRATYAVLAPVLAAVTIPVHAFALNAPWPKAPPASTHPDDSADQIIRSRPFWMLAAALTLSAFAVSAAVIALVPLLLERNYSTTEAAWALGLGGAGQTLGRTLYATLARRTGVTTRTVALIALSSLTTATLALVPGPYALLVVLSIAAGMVRGNLTLLQATAVTDRWGTTFYGRLSGFLGAPNAAASALAPFTGAALAALLGGYSSLFGVLALISAPAVFVTAVAKESRVTCKTSAGGRSGCSASSSGPRSILE
ncbi:MFS transporter [Streptomyces sp. A5-4]|uniref:MFS transporter n=1 Tax=Streptomyces sp. A5-4 TaxID=3384771 RepID=UPI003DA93A55